MPHELKGFDRLTHDTFTVLLVGIVVMAVALAAFVAFLRWRHPPKNKPGAPPAAAPRRKRRGHRR